MKKFLRNNGLSLSLAALFLIFWAAQAVAGYKVRNQDAVVHSMPTLDFGHYLLSGHFWQATGENWESEFLQMGAYVVMTAFLYQKGSAESNDPDAPEPTTGAKARSWLYRNSLSLTFLALFTGAFIIHATGGLSVFNDERLAHGEPRATLPEFLGDAEFWFQSFQNWQSEFLAVLSIVVLSIFLRQQGSPESKSVTDPHSKTGK